MLHVEQTRLVVTFGLTLRRLSVIRLHKGHRLHLQHQWTSIWSPMWTVGSTLPIWTRRTSGARTNSNARVVAFLLQMPKGSTTTQKEDSSRIPGKSRRHVKTNGSFPRSFCLPLESSSRLSLPPVLQLGLATHQTGLRSLDRRRVIYPQGRNTCAWPWVN